MAHAIIHTCGELVNPAEVVLDLSRQKVLVTNAVSRDRAALGELIGDHGVVLASTDAEVKQAKDHAQAIVFAHFRGDTRLKANVEQVTALGLDFDALDEDSAAAVRSRLHELGAAFVRYTTLSHGRVAGTHSFRAVLPTSRAMTPEEFGRVAPQLHARFPECDVQARDAARAWLLPMALAGGASPEREFHPGRVIDVDAMLAQSGVSTGSSPTKPTRAKAPASAGKKRGQKAPRHEEAEVLGMLSAVSADCDRTTWLKVGFALCEWDEVEGRRLWQDWSATGGGQYAGEAETQRVWEREVVPRVNSNDAAYRFDIDGLAKLAREGGWRPPTLILGTPGKRAMVFVSDDDGPRNTVDVGLDALRLLGMRSDCFLFNDRLCRVVAPKGSTPRIEPLTRISATNLLCGEADWITRHKKGVQRVSKPDLREVEGWLDLARHDDLAGSIRKLRGVATVPYIGRDGQIRIEPGYDATTRILLADHGLAVAVTVTDEPDQRQAAASAASDRILSHFEQVPFAAPTDAAGYLALLLTIVSRPLLEFAPSPNFLANANMSGAGKTRLIHTALMLLLGRRGNLSTLPVREEERQKYLLSEADAGADYVAFDNVSGLVGGPALESAITQGGTRGRRLCATERVDLPFAPCWMMTGNNARLTTDMVARTIEIYLNTPVAEPRAQAFKVPEGEWWEAYLPRHRASILSDLLGILLLHARAGYPAMPVSAGSFGEWERYIASAVWWATGLNVTETQKRLREVSDDDSSDLTALLVAWPKDQSFFAKELLLGGAATTASAGQAWDVDAFGAALAPFQGTLRDPKEATGLTRTLKAFINRRVDIGGGVLAYLHVDTDPKHKKARFSVQHSAGAAKAADADLDGLWDER